MSEFRRIEPSCPGNAALSTALIAGLTLMPQPAALGQISQAHASTARSSPSPAGGAETPVGAQPPQYLFPDVPPRAMVHDGTHFWIKPVLAWVTDYTTFSQDTRSLEQVGRQEDKGELRAGRLGASVRSKGRFHWEFYATVDYQERRNREKAAFQLYDLWVAAPLGPVKLTIGKMKEPISYELTSLSVLLPQQERILSPFFVTRSIGVKLSGNFAAQRVTWSAGAYNDYLDSGVARGRNGNDYVGRLTGLVWESAEERTRYLHVGLGYRRVGSDDGVMRFAGRPESNVADKYVDTGRFPADHADEISLEVLLSQGRFSLLAERFDSRVDSQETGDPKFSGYYATGSWVLTGEGRPYLRAGGFAGAITPSRRCGALELVLRYSHLDITDGHLDGGLLDKWHVGLNWWTSMQWKIGIGWGDADLHKGGTTGNTKMVLVRLQWLY